MTISKNQTQGIQPALWRNSFHGFGRISRSFHWIMAIGYFAMFGLGQYLSDIDYLEANYSSILTYHAQIGLSLGLLLIIRLIWKMTEIKPDSSSIKAWEKKLSSLVHIVLYILYAAVILTGYLFLTGSGKAVSFWGLTIPSFINNKSLADIMGDVHENMVVLLLILSLLHGLAALKHHFIDKDRTLMKMIKGA